MTAGILVMISCSSKREAAKIKKVLLEERKVACVNLISGVDSFFWWKGRIDSSREVLLLAKSERRMLRAIIRLVKKIHSYEVPEVIALPISAGSEDYLRWITESVKGKTKKRSLR
jgi:periplasmic divalent cation tolerance protein